MRRLAKGILLLGALCLANGAAEARAKQSAYAPECNVTMPCIGVTKSPAPRTRHQARRSRPERAAPAGLTTVSTAAGIDITVSPTFAPKIRAFIADLVARGYKPRSIHCFARGGHVAGSRHYSGNACDIDQRGWNKTARTMYRVADLARKHGVRDGCSFGDCGHIDDGRQLARARPHPFLGAAPRYAHLR